MSHQKMPLKITVATFMSIVMSAMAGNAQAQLIQIKKDSPIPLSPQECLALPEQFTQIKQSATDPVQEQPLKDLYRLGLALETCDNLTEALSVYQWAKTIDEPVKGSASRYSVPWDQYIAKVQVKRQQLDQALFLYRQNFTKGASKDLSPQQIDALAHQAIGTTLLQNQQLKTAERYFKESIRLEPENPFFYSALATVLVGQGNFDAAIQNFEQVDQYSSMTLSPQRRKARAGYNVALVLKGQDKHEAAKEWFSQAITADPTYDIAYLSLSQSQAKEGRYDAAIATLQRLLEIEPSLSGIHLTIASYYTRQNNKEKALFHYNKSLVSRQTQTPEADALAMLGHEFKLLNRDAEAANSYEQASQKDPENIDYLKSWAETLFDSGQWQQAVTVFKQVEQAIAAKNQAENQTLTLGAPLSVKWAKSLSRINRANEAIAVLKPLIDQATRPDPWLEWNYGKVLMQAGEQAEAARMFQASGATSFGWTELSSEKAIVLGLQGDALSELGHFQAAQPFFEQAITADPEFAYAYGGLGDVLRHQGLYEESVQAYEKAIQLDARQWRMTNYFWTGLGQTHLAKNDFEQATHAFQSALKYQEENLTARHGLGVAFLNEGKLEEAIAAFQQVLAVEPDHVQAQLDLKRAEHRLVSQSLD